MSGMGAAESTIVYSQRVRSLVSLVAAICVTCWLVIGSWLPTDDEQLIGRRLVGWLIPISWIPWLLLHWNHYQLVRCGRVAARYQQAPYFVNRPDILARLAMHVAVNWMVLATNVGAAWVLSGTREARLLSGLTIVASILTWSWFNWQHHRVNRAKNLVLSTVMALTIIAAATVTIRS